MKGQILLYGGCLAISFAAVSITSFIKLIVSGIAKKCGGGLSGNVKEYIFAPMAIIIAAAGLFFWLDKYIKMTFDEKFILILACFSVGTMLLYLLLFQPTRKFAMSIIRAIAQHFKVHEVVAAVKDALSEAEMFLRETEEDLHSNADQEQVRLEVAEKPPDDGINIVAEENLRNKSIDYEADKLRAMVEAIKRNI